MSSKKDQANDDARGNNLQQHQSGAVAASPEAPSEEVDGTDEEIDAEDDEEMDVELDENRPGDAENDEFEVDRQAASREPGKGDGSGERRGRESGADGKE